MNTDTYKVRDCFATLTQDPTIHDFIWADYFDSAGIDHTRLVDYPDYPEGADKALALIRTYEGAPVEVRPKVLTLVGSTID